MSRDSLQIDDNGQLRHFLSISGLNRQLLNDILDTAESFAGVTEQTVKKVPLLRGKTSSTCSSKPAPAPEQPLNWLQSVSLPTF